MKVWVSVQTFGMAAFRSAVSRGMELAVLAAEYIHANSNLELMAPASLGTVCFRANPSHASLGESELEELNKTVLARVFWDDRSFMSSTLPHGTLTLRLCIVNHATTWDDVRETLETVGRFGREEYGSWPKQGDGTSRAQIQDLEI